MRAPKLCACLSPINVRSSALAICAARSRSGPQGAREVSNYEAISTHPRLRPHLPLPCPRLEIPQAAQEYILLGTWYTLI